jgi:hypothetical protein
MSALMSAFDAVDDSYTRHAIEQLCAAREM